MNWLNVFNNLKTIAAFVVFAIVCILICVVVIKCNSSAAQKKVDTANENLNEAREEIKALKKKLDEANSENTQLKRIIDNTNKAVDVVVEGLTTAQAEHEERINELQTIEVNDPVVAEWLSCELPPSVRDVFKDYCYRDEDGSAAKVIAYPLR